MAGVVSKWISLHTRCRSTAFLVVGIALATGAVHAHTSGAPLYRAIELVPPGHCRLKPVGMNDRGDIAGYLEDTERGGIFLYDHAAGKVVDLGSPGSWMFTIAGIDDHHRIAGTFNPPKQRGGHAAPTHTFLFEQGPTHAFIFEQGKFRDLGTLGGDSSDANAMNADGLVTGYADLPDGSKHAFLYQNGKMLDLGTLGGVMSWGFDINLAGQVVGVTTNARGTRRPFLYSNGKMQDLAPDNPAVNDAWKIDRLGNVLVSMSLSPDASTSDEKTPGESKGNLDAIWERGKLYPLCPSGSNDPLLLEHGVAAGGVDYPGSGPADFRSAGFVYSTDRGIQILPPTTRPECMNASGWVAGGSTWSTRSQRAFLYRAGTFCFLDSNCLVNQKRNKIIIQDAECINDAGEIAATGTENGRPAAFLLEPVKP